MAQRKLVFYYAWSRPGEIGAPLPIIEKKLDVLARQRIDLTAPPHPFVQSGHSSFDALLQSRPGVFAGALLIGDATLWSSTAGGVDSLRHLWENVVRRPVVSAPKS